MRHHLAVLALLLAAPAFAAEPPEGAGPDKAPPEFARLKYRSVGPSAGGRICRVAGVPGDPRTYYAATAGGGIWKSEDGGASFKPVFDDHPASVGSIAVAPSDPNVIYAGTGEANVRGNVQPGDGIYKSTDGGKTWKHVWKAVGHIGTMAVHPKNADVAFAAVLGHAFGPNPERGVYRTTDGGRTWKRVLFKDNDTGASDIAIDPNNPRVVFAGLWQVRRRPWEMTSGGPGSGLYVSRDGGDRWEQLGPGAGRGARSAEREDGQPGGAGDNGLPAGPWGKVCVAVAPSDSRRVYAMIEAEKGGLYRSDDGGASWHLASDHRALRQRAWYFSTITVDPSNPNVIYAPQVRLLKSIDGGKTWRRVKGTHHGDHHDVWIDPKDPKRIIDGNDGGVDMSVNGGQSWYAPPLPISQFYHVACDNRTPYRVMGCMQDLGSASGPSNSLNAGGILLGDWYGVGGGEAGYAVPDPSDPNVVYAGEYGGYISRYDHRTGQARNVSIYPFNASGHDPANLKYRFQWTAPIMISRHDRAVYHAANVVFRTTDGGQTWQPVSGDLTRNDRNKQRWSGGPITGDNTGVEVYGTIFALAESPKQAGVLWAGSDDGLVHVSRDNGKTWQNVTANVPDLPDWGTVSGIEASPFDAGTAYLVVDAHRLDDYRPHVWKTADFGKSWTLITDGLKPDVYVHVIREDPKRKGLLYLGTERGVMFSPDNGSTWKPLQLNLPRVSVHDLVVKDNDLVVGTHGRSIWILDDLSPVRGWSQAVANKSAHLFAPEPAVRWRYTSPVTLLQERGAGENPPKGAVIDYALKAKPQKPITLEILDADGKRVVLFDSKESPPGPDEDGPDSPEVRAKKPQLPAEPGVNRFVWDLTYPGSEVVPKARIDTGDPTVGPLVLPGTYTVNLTVGGKVLTTKLEVKLDPRVETIRVAEPMPPAKTGSAPPEKQASPRGERLNVKPRVAAAEPAWAVEQEKFALRLRDDVSRLAEVVKQIRSVRKQLQQRDELLADDASAKELLKQSRAFAAKLDTLEAKLHNPKAQVVYDILAQKGGAKLYSQLVHVLEFTKDADGPPTQGLKEMAATLEKELDRYAAEFEALRAGELAKLNALARKLQVPTIWVPPLKK